MMLSLTFIVEYVTTKSNADITLLFWISNRNSNRRKKRESLGFSRKIFFLSYYYYFLFGYHENWVTDLNLWSNINTIQPLNKQLSAISTWKRRIECEWEARRRREKKIFAFSKFSSFNYGIRCWTHWSISHKGKKRFCHWIWKKILPPRDKEHNKYLKVLFGYFKEVF